MPNESPKESAPTRRLRAKFTSWGIRGACYLGLSALLLMFIGTVYPKPLFVIASMSLAQALGGLAALTYLAVVLNDLRR